MDYALSPVDHQQRAVCVAGVCNLSNRVDQSEHVGYMCNGYDFCARRQQGREEFRTHSAAIIDRKPFENSTLARANHLPGNEIGMMLRLADQNLVSGLNECLTGAKSKDI